jgi:16S rRNA A1518/A1519 N6-dimethyltransferase RsmA/KsgA/DIM1 with predicted DNA glycosylase/AP lyase activity
VARSSFLPQPKVDSAIVHLERLVDSKRFTPAARKLIRKIFPQRRKQIATSLKTFATKLERHHFTPSIHPEQLPIAF